jgi:hypothetical protein
MDDGASTSRSQRRHISHRIAETGATNGWRIARVLRETHPGSGDRVLVAVMNDPRDLDIARTQSWYRIPIKRAPTRVGADYLAFYFTGAFPPQQRHRIVYYAPIRAYRLAIRAELLPNEPDHPRAQERYFKVEIGALCELACPIVSLRLRRITFIATTLDRLLHAREINELWLRPRDDEAVWAALERSEPRPDLEGEKEEGYAKDTSMW